MGAQVNTLRCFGRDSTYSLMLSVNELMNVATLQWVEWDKGERRYVTSSVDLADVRVSMRRRSPEAPHLVLDVAGKRKIAQTLCGARVNDTMANLAMFPVGDDRGSEMWDIMCKECKATMVAIENGDTSG